jgi:hypothetical protein
VTSAILVKYADDNPVPPPLNNALCTTHCSMILRMGTNSIMTSGVAG